MLQKIKVLVVDDSAFMRKVTADILKEDEIIDVVGFAANGEEALLKIGALKPDVVTMDIEMPVMNGLTCLKKIMKSGFVPVVILSNLTREGEKATIEALESGAIDFITKPTNIFEITAGDKKKEIIEKVKVASKASRITAKIRKNILLKRNVLKAEAGSKKGGNTPKSEDIKYIIAIGASTGGPKSLHEIIPFIPADLPAAIFITQHMPPGFTRSLAERLNSLSQLFVKEAEDNEIVYAGRAYIAPGDYHMLVERVSANRLIIRLSHAPPVNSHRPSIDVMMESISRAGAANIMAVILTGMGRDGSEGIKKLKQQNQGYIIAQDERTCVVYGMPKIAVETGMVDAVVPLNNIAEEIKRFMGVLV